MLPESTNGTGGGGEQVVPMAWWSAESMADELLRTGRLVAPGSLEYLAGRQTLALTIYLCDETGALAGARAVARIDEWLSRTSHGHPWPQWVRERLAAREAREPRGGPGPDLLLARRTWRRLESTEVLAADLTAAGRPVEESAQVWTPAWQLGLPLGHLAIHLY
ncbi:hypothetical protein [Streptomyces purpureus]|uniref:Uncharacterized protein n=1 Tax=Streptomyces purpureus TaxID=1951 RepID=A0A918LLH8_9ACTN|nr:hypothetical protein [Streptomyces purpureus]GGT13229.1 hypothetical protein GCM10014713_02160 [Streptomyces purpureus]